MKIAMAQTAVSPDMDVNVDKTLNYMEQAKDCDLLFFPEIQWTPFFPQYEAADLEANLGKTVEELVLDLEDARIRKLQETCKAYGLWLSPNLYIEQNGKRYDTSLMIDDAGNLQGISKMVHVLQARQFYEVDYYEPSEEGFKVYETPFGKVGIVICFDRHLPESIRTCAVKGAELIIIPTVNVKSEPLEMFEWELRVQAFQNNVFIAMCNRVGVEGAMEFAGESLIVDCDGNVVYKAGDSEELIVRELDLSRVPESRKKRPYIELRRPECYR
jgi:N-carbamoylputrescine amidase